MEIDLSKNVVFDVGRVLIDWDVYALYRKLLPDDASIDAFLEEVDFFKWNLEMDRGLSFSQGVEQLSAAFPHRADLIKAYDERWEEAVTGPIQGTVDLLNQLKDQGTSVYAITNFSTEKWALTTQRFEFLRTSFADVLVSGEEKLVKPDPQIYQLFLERNSLGAESCVFVDDSAANVQGAKSVGIDAVLFTTPAAFEADLRSRRILT